jgi:hypothetical protein
MSNAQRLVAHDATTTFVAGGIVAKGAKLPADARTSPISARAYPHPGMEAGKVIVRLEPDAVAAGVDAEMAAFGFAAPQVTDALGQVRYRTLGFPAWALVHEPKKAKAALDVVEELRKAKRLVAAKPGHAKEAFEKIAKQLQRAAPQFLPSFWEECGRVVADQASQTMAAQCFERARQAERAFKLKIDADDADAVFVEFALLGALSAKTLSQYAKDLAKLAGGKEAYRRFRAIAVKRALGGMPPWSGMGKDMHALIDAADLDVDKEDDALVVEMLDAPGIAKAPGEFWTTYKPSIERLGARDQAVRARLRNLWPDPRGGSDESRAAFRTSWLELLREIGALSDLPDDGLGAWTTRMIRYMGNTPEVRALLAELAPRLAKLAQPIQVVAQSRRWWSTQLDLDLAELALSLGIPLGDPPSDEEFDNDSWTCDPVRVAAEPRYAKKLVEMVAGMMGESSHEPKMRGKAGFIAARRAWVEERLVAIETGTFVTATYALDYLESKTTAETFLPFPELHARLAELDLAPALAKQLAGGSADELTWPAYEQAVATLGGELQVRGAFPVVVAWNASKAIALDAGGVIAEHDFVYKPKDETITNAFFIDGQFLVALKPKKEWKQLAYWSGAPKQRFDLEAHLPTHGGETPTLHALPDGRVTLGHGKPFRAGDTTFGGRLDVLTDGTSYWIADWKGCYAYDLEQGKKGAAGKPAFLDWPRDGWEVHAGESSLAVVNVPSSPLGVKDGLSGVRARAPKGDDDGNKHELERIDGARWEGDMVPAALVSLPGDAAPRPAQTTGAESPRFRDGEGPGIDLYTFDSQSLGTCNKDEWATRGWGAVPVPPLAFWHYLAPRDAAGSAALRAITVDTPRALLHAARGELTGDASGRALPQTTAAVRAALPQIRDAALARGVIGIVERAAELAARIGAIAAERAKENADPSGEGLLQHGAAVRKLASALASGRAIKIPDFGVELKDWLLAPHLHAALALLPLADDDKRRTARDMCRALAGTILAGDLSKLRWLELEEPDDYSCPDDWQTVVIQVHEGSVFAVDGNSDWALELSRDGTFRVPPPFALDKATKLDRGIGDEWARAYLELPDAALPWDPAMATQLAARADLSLPEATLLALGAPERHSYGKDFLGKQKREQLGLKMGEADAARTTFKELDDDVFEALLARAVPDDARLLATPLAPGAWIDRLGDAWKKKFGKRVKVPQDLIAQAKKELDNLPSLPKYLAALAGEDDAWFFEVDTRPLPQLGGWRDEKGLTPNIAKELATLLAWLFVARPVGDAIRAGIPRVIDKLRAAVDDRRALWALDDRYTDDDDAKDKKLIDDLFAMVGGKEIELPKSGDVACARALDDGAIVIAQYGTTVSAGFRPAALDGAAKKKVEALAKAMWDPDNGDGPEQLASAVLVRSDGLAALGERVTDTPVGEGGFEANPLASAAKLVAKVAKAEGVSSDAAALYLQVLALAEPTERNVQRWNEWTPKQYKAAAAELVKKKLVVEGKRERAGRSIFVKGGYTKGAGRDLPTEEWKLPFYSGLDRHVPAEPCHLLFARAYKRVEDGDGP